MGGGSISVLLGTNPKRQTIIPLADYIKQELLSQFRQLRRNETSTSDHASSLLQPYFDVTTNDALAMILDLLSMKQNPSQTTVTVTTDTLLPPMTRLELVCVASVSYTNSNQRRGRMIRKRISDIWGMKTKLRVS